MVSRSTFTRGKAAAISLSALASLCWADLCVTGRQRWCSRAALWALHCCYHTPLSGAPRELGKQGHSLSNQTSYLGISHGHFKIIVCSGITNLLWTFLSFRGWQVEGEAKKRGLQELHRLPHESAVTGLQNAFEKLMNWTCKVLDIYSLVKRSLMVN